MISASNWAGSSAAAAKWSSASKGKLTDEDEMQMNPIRRVVSLLQNMAKKIEEEGKREQELYDKFMCYCQNSGDALGSSIAENDAAVPAIQSDIEEAEAKVVTTKQELADHQTG